MRKEEIVITKAKVHNLKSVSLKIPKNTLTVITGPSGSGKSSLAFDTIYVEGQRRYIESLSSYARQFLGVYNPPDVESISGLSPAIAIDQKASNKNPRSTVGTVTEIYDYLRILFARTGTFFCPDTGVEIKRYSAPQIAKILLEYPVNTKISLLSPALENVERVTEEELHAYQAQGFVKGRVNGEIIDLSDVEVLKKKRTKLDLVIDRILIKEGIVSRLASSIEEALKIGNGKISVLVEAPNTPLQELFFSEHLISPKTKKVYPALEPKLFSFNSPLGACPECNGLGELQSFNKELMISDRNLSINDGAILPLSSKKSFLYQMIKSLSIQENFSLDTPLCRLPKKALDIIFDGSETVYDFKFISQGSTFKFSKSFPGLYHYLNKRFHEAESDRIRQETSRYMYTQICPECKGLRLNKIALSTKINGKNLMQLCILPIDQAYAFFETLKLSPEKTLIAEKLLKEIKSRFKFLLDVGLNYLSLNRASMTLSGGESQRIRLATQIGSGLSGVLYVLDEPSIGLHQKDNIGLLNTLKALRDLGNTILVVEHDEEAMRLADYLIDMGPGAGVHGGEILAQGKYQDVIKNKKSLTARYLSKRESIEIPLKRRTLTKKLTLVEATKNNLKHLTLDIPLGGLICVTGVSGSGKSTLIHDILVPAISQYLKIGKTRYLKNQDYYKTLLGAEAIDSIIELDQSPIGRNPNSNPATYANLFSDIRDIFAKVPEAQIKGYKAGRFSFNVKGGRCDECEGDGVKKIEMHFLPDVYITCTECGGTRYNKETLNIRYKGKNIADVLDFTIDEAFEFFKNHQKIARILLTMKNVGLGYMKLGQAATTLSGGEAQRLKLSRELGKRTQGSCLYVLDEPTTGLHFSDIKILLKALNQLIDQGHTVIVIEHNLDVIKTADYIIDMGPEGGNMGGKVVASGTPEELTSKAKTHTAKYLKKVLENDKSKKQSR